MKVLMVAKQKGGVGATTVARELGVAAARAGLTSPHRVARPEF
jgi:cellulose biosynthesis protein BcsQ